MRWLIELLTLIAVLLMPFGMAGTPAATMHRHAGSMQMPMRHCPEHGKPVGKAAFVECTMACSAALPATEIRRDEPMMVVCQPVQPTAAQRLDGLHPETATPPPKRS